MTKAGKGLGLILSGLLINTAANGVTPDSPSDKNPYQGIVERNVFGLKPPPPPPPPPEQPKPPVNITLTGITTLGGKKRAFMSVSTAPKPGAAATPQSYMLAEGERDGEIEIVQIDEKEGSVKLKQGDSPVTISFKDNGVKGGPAPAAMAGGPAPSGGLQPNPFTPTAFPGQKTIPGRPLRIPGTNPSGANPSGINSAGTQPGSLSPGGASIPNQNSPQFTIQQQTPQMSAEEAELIVEAEHQHALSKGDPSAALYPPTVLNPTRNLARDDLNPNPTQPQSQFTPANPQLPLPPGQPRRFR